METFKTVEVARIAGIPFQSVHYWLQTGMVRASIRGRTGRRGADLRWSKVDLRAVLAVVQLRRQGVSLPAVRSIARYLQSTKRNLSDVCLVVDTEGKRKVRAVEGSKLYDVLGNPGQLEFQPVILPMKPILEEIDAGMGMLAQV